jgi:hemolysin activation/secretion protein
MLILINSIYESYRHIKKIRSPHFLYIAISLALFLVSPPSGAQQTSAGSLLQGIRSQELETTLPQVAPNIDRTKSTKAASPMEATFIAKRFAFIGNTKVSSEKLNSLIYGYLNRPITFNDLKSAADLIAEYYRDKGWLIKTQIPQQDVTEGVVTIEIMEASLGGVLINNKSKRVSNVRVENWIYSAIPRNAPLSLSTLDRALLTLNDLPEIQVASSLQEGKRRGETNVLLTVTDKSLVDSLVGVDNFGQSSTGQNRATASLNINGPLGLGEQVNVYGLYTEGTNYGRIALTTPIGSDGLRVGINGSYLSYRVINPSFNQLFANGTSSTGGAELTYPIIRSRPANLFLLGNYNYSSFNNNANGGTTSQYSTSVFLGGLSGNLLDGFAGGGINTGSLIASGGAVNLNTSPSLSSDVIGPQVNGNFTKLRYAANRLQAITSSLSAYLGVSGQFASKNLDSSEQLYLGGPYSVRAYATGQGNASQGNLMTFELRQTLPMNLLLTGFYDYANVQTYKTSYFASAPLNNTYALQGLGSSIGWSGPLGLQIKAIWAMRTGTLPTLVTQSFNGNGGTSSNRFWLTASLPI